MKYFIYALVSIFLVRLKKKRKVFLLFQLFVAYDNIYFANKK